MKIYSKQRQSRGYDLADGRSAAQSFGPFRQAWSVLPGDSVRPSIVVRHRLCQLYTYLHGDRGSTVVKVLCYKSKGRWFDPSWCHWNFSLI